MIRTVLAPNAPWPTSAQQQAAFQTASTRPIEYIKSEMTLSQRIEIALTGESMTRAEMIEIFQCRSNSFGYAIDKMILRGEVIATSREHGKATYSLTGKKCIHITSGSKPKITTKQALAIVDARANGVGWDVIKKKYKCSYMTAREAMSRVQTIKDES
jgi:hypothetical protein